MLVLVMLAACGDKDAGNTSAQTNQTSQTDDSGGDPTGDPTAGSATDTGGTGSQGECDDYLACIGAVSPDKLGAAEMAYGPGSACWQSGPELMQGCLDACAAGLLALGQAYPDEPKCKGAGSGTTSDDPTGGVMTEPTTEPTTGSSTGGVACTPGQVNCDCINDTCEGGAICGLGKCLPAGDGSCLYEFDGVCEEPEFCEPGSDPFDCCASPQDGACEEIDYGGVCSPYSDFFDCGYCPFVNDGQCDDGLCPVGTDEADCCATPGNGVCEEMSQGGLCADGSDTFDCGGCPYEDDGSRPGPRQSLPAARSPLLPGPLRTHPRAQIPT